MTCTNCQTNSDQIRVFDIQYIYNSACSNDCTECNGNIVDSKCVVYSGPALPCSTIATNDSIELALQKIDEILCSVAGDYSTYNINCLDGPITTEAQFVEKISEYACNLETTFSNFTGTTFPTSQGVQDTAISNINNPAHTCASLGVTDTDTRIEIFTKICTKFTDLDSNLDLSSVTWNTCFTVVTPPTTVHDGFDLLADQICQVKTIAETGTSLPVFNNTGSCLPSPGSADSLVSTVGKIKTRLCQTPTLTNSELTSACVDIPGTDTDLQTLLQSLLTKIDYLTQNLPASYSEDFDVTNVNDEDLCLGKNLALATPINQDRYVASNDADTSPGTLADKLVEGDGIGLDFGTAPGQVIISADGSDYKVKASVTDTAEDYLDQKINGVSGSNGLTISSIYNGGTQQIDIIPSVSLDTFAEDLLNAINSNPDLKAIFCGIVSDCLLSTTTTSTSTTTTTTTTALP